MIGVGVVGCGYWGSHLIRNFASADGARVVHVCDLSAQRLDVVQQGDPQVRAHTDYRDLIADPHVDAVVVATPAGTHFPVALESLRAGKHVLVAKPLATSSEQAQRLDEEAAKRHLTLMVGHTFVYSGAVRRIQQLISAGDLGEVLYYDSVRANLGVFQSDVNVLWDLAVHDLSILDYLLDVPPVAVSATGARHLADQNHNLAFLTLFYPGSMIAHLHVSWVAPVKVRRIHIGGSRRMVAYDDTKTEGKVSLYDKGFALDDSVPGGPPRVRYRDDGMTVLPCDAAEPLGTEIAHFVDCVGDGHRPQTDARCGGRVLTVLEAAARSLEERGRLIELPSVDGAGDVGWTGNARAAAASL